MTREITKTRTWIGLLFVTTMLGCSPEAQPPRDDSAAPVQIDAGRPVNSTQPQDDASLIATDSETSVSTETTSSENADTNAEGTEAESTEEDVTKFVGLDGRERVVPTGPPPTDREGRLELTFDDLSFEMEKGAPFNRSMLTERIKKFHGADVRLRGFIRPSFRQSKIEKFVFVRDDKECCFGPGAAVYDNALVSLKKGTHTDYTVRPVVVIGQLHLKEYEAPDGMILSIYRIKNGEIE